MRYAGKQFVAVAAVLLLMVQYASAQNTDTLRVDKRAVEAQQEEKGNSAMAEQLKKWLEQNQ